MKTDSKKSPEGGWWLSLYWFNLVIVLKYKDDFPNCKPCRLPQASESQPGFSLLQRLLKSLADFSSAAPFTECISDSRVGLQAPMTPPFCLSLSLLEIQRHFFIDGTKFLGVIKKHKSYSIGKCLLINPKTSQSSITNFTPLSITKSFPGSRWNLVRWLDKQRELNVISENCTTYIQLYMEKDELQISNLPLLA